MRVLTLLLSLVATSALAHDFWIEPVGDALSQPVNVHIRIGPAYTPDDEYPFNPLHIVKFWRIAPDGVETRFAGFTGQRPAARFTPKQPGYYTIGYQSAVTQITLGPEKFEAYLREEGLTNVLAWRAAQGASAAPGKEAFARNAKALIRVGDAQTGFDQVLGMPLELVLHSDPMTVGTLTFALLRTGKPVVNARVAAYAGAKATPVEGRTDAQGRVTLDLPTPGMWLVKSVSAERTSGIANWRSEWASLTVKVGR
ncbi:MAG: putative GH25 family protein [Bradymonadia bacterium]|jgi:uncharacterized GH25 family protein